MAQSHVEQRTAEKASLTPFWILLGFSVVLLFFLGGQYSLFSTVTHGAAPHVTRDPVCFHG